jgi:hypothetical protein
MSVSVLLEFFLLHLDGLSGKKEGGRRHPSEKVKKIFKYLHKKKRRGIGGHTLLTTCTKWSGCGRNEPATPVSSSYT